MLDNVSTRSLIVLAGLIFVVGGVLTMATSAWWIGMITLPISGLLAWIALGVWGRSIMRDKGRSGEAGFAFGLLLGPMGLVLAMLMGPSTEHLAEALEKRQPKDDSA